MVDNEETKPREGQEDESNSEEMQASNEAEVEDSTGNDDVKDREEGANNDMGNINNDCDDDYDDHSDDDADDYDDDDSDCSGDLDDTDMAVMMELMATIKEEKAKNQHLANTLVEVAKQQQKMTKTTGQPTTVPMIRKHQTMFGQIMTLSSSAQDTTTNPNNGTKPAAKAADATDGTTATVKGTVAGTASSSSSDQKKDPK